VAKRSKARVDAWVDETVTAPRQFVPNPQENKRARFVRKYVWFATFALIPTMLISLGTIANIAAPQDEEASTAVDGFDQSDEGRDGQARARLALDEWLGSDTSPLPAATVLSFDGSVVADPVAPETATNASGETEVIERHNIRVFRFSLSTANGAVWLASVPVGFSAAGAQVAATPSVMPATPSDDSGWAGQLWPGERLVNLSPHVTTAVETWAEAYTSGDPERLRQAVGDPNTANSYLPIAGATFNSVVVGQATVRLQDLEADGTAPTDPEYVVARVLLRITWPGQQDVRDSDIRPFSFDVLISDPAGAPRVVAWAPAGQGGALEPFANAIGDRTVSGNPSAVPSDTTMPPPPAGTEEPQDEEPQAPAEPEQADPDAEAPTDPNHEG